jgi:hypothetical protein
MHGLLLMLATFPASGVEMIEALTIVLAVGVTWGWRSTLVGAAAATAVLALIVALLGPAVTRMPIGASVSSSELCGCCSACSGSRKAILRSSGYTPLQLLPPAARTRVCLPGLQGKVVTRTHCG